MLDTMCPQPLRGYAPPVQDCALCCPVFRPQRLFVDPFDPLSTRDGSNERVRKVLRLPRNFVTPELHNAHCVGRPAVIGQDEFGDPEVTAANNASDRKPLFAWLASALALYVAPTAGPLARLRVVQHRIFAIDAVLGFRIVDVGCRPVLIQCPHGSGDLALQSTPPSFVDRSS